MRVINPADVDIEAFLAVWFGPKNNVVEPVDRFSMPLPDGLMAWLSLAEQWEVPANGVKMLSRPSEMMEEEGKYVFLADHGGWAWAFDPNVPRTVYEAKDDEPWRPLRAEWKEVFFQYVLTEAIESAPVTTWCSEISESGMRAALERFDEVSFTDGGWPGPGWRWYVTEGMVAYSGPKRSINGQFAVTIGGTSSDLVSQLNLSNGSEWRVRENL
ncbi:hypothetical protein ACFYYM_34415 [Streptomyces erythrochromogenes]|uniref:hypothetical protein n=1 Tax=Streptomyces erythrochromogenes TaxID=285574 RepID=UPI0036754AD4